MDFVVDFRMLKLSGVKCHWVQAVFLITLGKDGPYCQVRGIGLDDNWFCQVEMGQYGCCGEPFLQFFESGLHFWVP